MPYLPEKQNTISFSLTVLYPQPNKFRTTPLLPTCHPERSGTPGVKASDATKQRRAVEPRPPGGAPAGGISVVPTHCVTQPPHPGSRTERSEGEDFEAPPQTPLRASFRKSPRNSKSFTAKGTRKRSTCRHEPPLRVPFAVKFLEFLEPSPKEGSKRGLGRRPKVFPSGSKQGLGRRPKVLPLPVIP